MEVKIKAFHAKQDKIYKLIKLHTTGQQELKGFGEVHYGSITIGRSALVGAWITSTVDDIILTGKGCIFETLNSTYLLEEVENISGLDGI